VADDEVSTRPDSLQEPSQQPRAFCAPNANIGPDNVRFHFNCPNKRTSFSAFVGEQLCYAARRGAIESSISVWPYEQDGYGGLRLLHNKSALSGASKAGRVSFHELSVFTAISGVFMDRSIIICVMAPMLPGRRKETGSINDWVAGDLNCIRNRNRASATINLSSKPSFPEFKSHRALPSSRRVSANIRGDFRVSQLNDETMAVGAACCCGRTGPRSS
jgi:hypothetical protein